MRVNALTKDNCTQYGSGPERKVLVMHEWTGLGTVPHAMPGLVALKNAGCDITINCRAFQAPMYRTIGVSVTTEREPFGPYRSTILSQEYGRIISVQSWDGWRRCDNGGHDVGTMFQYAEIIGSQLPETFSWLDYWKPEKINRPDYILFNPNAYEPWRSLPDAVANEIETELRKYADVIRIKGDEYPDWETLRDIVANARTVVTVEGGISNIAGAMNRPLVMMTGLTDAEPHVGQYRKYLPALRLIEIKGFQPNGCSMPCYGQPSKGFKNNKCVGQYDYPMCLKMINTDHVIESTLTLYEHGTIFERSN